MVARFALTVVLFLTLLAPSAHAADPAQVGRWSPIQTYPITPISAAVTTDGKIIAWDQSDPAPKHNISPNNGRAVVIDPDVGVIARSVNLAPTSVFCPLITTLPDGKVAIVGGGNDTSNLDRTVIYNPETRTFGAWGSLSRGRWYAGGNIDSRGNILAIGGRGGTGADVVDAASGIHRRLGVGFGDWWYPHVLRAPDGRFVIENISQVTTPSRQWLNIEGNGTLSTISDRTLLQSRRRLTSTMVGPYSMLMITGGTTKSAYVLDVSSGTAVPRATGALKFPHMTGTAVTLPDGSAMVIGGNSSNHETQGTPVMTPELWSPSSGQWTSMADSPRRRLYHSVAALLPDGRVWSAGTSAFGQDEYNGSYFQPPYLFKKDGSGDLAPRPQVSDAPRSVAWGERFSVRSPQASSIRGAALIRLAATTHQYAFDQNYVPLEVSRDGDRLEMTVPSNGNTIPAGQYMLFLVDENGVPSKAPTVEVKPTAATQPAAIATQSTQYISSWGQAGKAFDGDTRNSVGGTWAGNHTNLQSEPWLDVDLGRSRDLERLTLYNRTDRYGERLRSAWVFTSDAPLTTTTVAGSRAQAGVTARQITNSPGATVEVPVDRTARYIRIQLPRNDYLHLREVVPTFRTASPNLAVGKVSETDTQTVVKVTNTGTGGGTISSLTMPGAGWSQTAGPSTPFTVDAGGAAQLTLARGTADGDLTVTTSAGAVLRLALQGVRAPDPEPVLAAALGDVSDTQVAVRVTNTGDAAGSIQSVELTGTGWAQTSGPSAPFDVPAGGEAVLVLTRGTTDGEIVLAPTQGTALRVALPKAPAPDPDPEPEPSTVPDPTEGGWQLNGSSTLTGGRLELTSPLPDQKGTAFWPTALDTSGGLTVEYQASIGDGTGADGLALVLADPARGATPTSVGGGGGHLGFGGIPGWAVALASYPNGTQLVGNFAGISDGARGSFWQTLNWVQSMPMFFAPLQNSTRTVRVTIAGGTVTVTVDGTPVLSQAVDLPDRILLGFSAATGGLTNRHAISDLDVQGGAVPPPPPPPPSAVPDPAEGGWQLNGSSTITGGSLRLTDAAPDQKGSAFWPTPLEIGDGLTVEYDAEIAGGTGADGLTMVLADPARGATPTSIGDGGGVLGFGGLPGWAVALSSFPNGTQTRGNFIGVTDGSIAGVWRTLNWLSASPLTTPLQNTTRRVRVTFTRTSITATIDGGTSVTHAVDLPERVLLGFTAATGGLTNRHVISGVSVTG